jgi:hypothetical protein
MAGSVGNTPPKMLPRIFTSVENIPQFRTLILGDPLTKFITVRKKTLLGAGLFLITTRTTDTAVKFISLYRV